MGLNRVELMELKELTIKICELFRCEQIDDLPSKIMGALFGDNTSIYFDKYIELCPDLSVDYLQKVFQFYHADRSEKKQDYTPVMMARLIGLLTTSTKEKSVYDCCAGSGSLSIQKWVVNPDLKFVCEELDETVIPLLIFNLCVRNIEACVINKNILTGEILSSYKIAKGSKYSVVTKNLFAESELERCSTSLSNPPFNLKLNACEYITNDLPTKYTSNFAFVAHCLQRAERQVAVILPRGVMSSSEESECRKHYIENGWLKAVIPMPDNMFESTSIPTCILLFDKQKKTKDVTLINAEEMKTLEVRMQRGEGRAFGRVYKKELSTFTEEQLIAICSLIGKSQEPYSVIASYEDLRNNGYNLIIGFYLKPKYEGSLSRDFNDIIKDLNRVIQERNIIRLNVNKVWAEKLGLTEIVSMCEQSNIIVNQLNKSLESFENYDVDCKISDNRYIKLSDSKVFLIENTDKGKLSTLIALFINMYKQHICYLNDEENRYLAELRDALLPELMNGNLKLY